MKTSITRLKKIALCITLLAGIVYAASDQAERKIVHREEPLYPEIAQKMNLHGTVKMKVWIKPDGTVRRVEYVGGHPLLAESALKALKEWTYTTAPKESTSVVELKF